MITTQKDLAYLEAGIPELMDYLLSKELYWPITSRGYDLPRLTIGGLLLALAKLEATGERTQALMDQLHVVRTKWRTAWETKATREVQARAVLWQNFLADYRQNPYQNADGYPHEVRNRVMLQLLVAEIPASPADREMVSRMDSLLQASFVPGDFIWEAEYNPGFPKENYWFLYGTLKS